MPKKDVYHEMVRNALIQNGWIITDDPFWMSYGGRNVFADLAAERLIGAEKGTRRILVEVKSFTGLSEIHELEVALGQYNLYRDILAELEPERSPYLAIPRRAYKSVFTDSLGQLVLKRERLELLVFDEQQGGELEWIPQP